MLESLFHKVAGRKTCKFIKKRHQRKCFPVNIAKFLRTAILKNIIRERLPLIFSKNLNQILHEQKYVTFNNDVTINLTFRYSDLL